jgi:hypothetical protein
MAVYLRHSFPLSSIGRDLHRRLADEMAKATNDDIKTILKLEIRSK